MVIKLRRIVFISFYIVKKGLYPVRLQTKWATPMEIIKNHQCYLKTKMRNFVSLSLLLILLFLNSGCSGEVPASSELTQCKIDTDCIIVSSECGDCDYDTINRIHEQAFKNNYEERCKNTQIYCDAIVQAVPRCVQNECQLLTCEDLVAKSNEDDRILSECNKYIARICNTNQDCGPFPCVDDTIHTGVSINRCLIQPCTADEQCPNGMCGLHATPVPGFCTTTDII